MLATKTAATPESATAESATAESAGAHASPAATTLGPRRPAARTAESTKSAGVPAHAAESVGSPSSTIMLCPGVRGRGTIGAEVLSILFVDVDCVSAHVPVIAVAAASVVVRDIRVVVGIVVAVAVVVATVVIPAVPGRIAVEGTAVIHHCTGVPVAIPAAISPTATPTTTAHQCTHGNSSAEPNHARCDCISRAIPGSHVAGGVDHRRLVLRHGNGLGVRRLNGR